MPSIVSHNKSRSGCDVCKRRKVKCGEEAPECLNCRKRGLKCSYTTTLRFKAVVQRPKQVATSSKSTQTLACLSPQTLVGFFPAESRVRSGSLIENRYLELRMMHFYTISTSRTWSPAQELWVATAPQAAFNHHFLLDAIMAVATLHWSTSSPEDESWALKASSEYFTKALSSHTRALQKATQPGHAMPLLLTSALVAFYSLVQLGRLNSSSDDVDIEALLQWVRLAKGCNAIWRTGSNTQELHQSQAMKHLFARFPDFHSYDISFAPEHSEKFTFLQDWSMESEELSDGDIQVYEDVIRYTGFLHQSVRRKDPPVLLTRRVISMIPRCSPRFGELLLERRPRALVILAHAFAALKSMRNEMWWVNGITDYVFAATRTSIPTDWKPLMPKS